MEKIVVIPIFFPIFAYNYKTKREIDGIFRTADCRFYKREVIQSCLCFAICTGWKVRADRCVWENRIPYKWDKAPAMLLHTTYIGYQLVKFAELWVSRQQENEYDMKKLHALAIFLVLATLSSWAQDNIKVSRFSLLENDLTANTHGTQKLDQNGEKAALIKIQAPEQGFTFNGGSLGIVAREDHDGEIWLYVPRRAKRLTIQHKDYGVLRDYYYPVTVDGGRTYEMYLDIGIGRYVTVTSEIAGATIYIDGANCGEGPLNHKYLNYGRHTARAVKDRYEGEKVFMITTEDAPGIRLENVEMRDMSDHFGDVTINVANNADIYFEDRKVGTGSFKTQLREGTYTVETRKADCDSAKTSFTVMPQQQNVVEANPPTPHTGWLRIFTRPGNVMATYNGDKAIDLSETVSVPIGTYQMQFARRGYVTQNHEYLVKHNRTTTDTITLERIKYIKPQAFYFGAGYAARKLGGITALVGATYRNFDLQASYTFGMASSDEVPWYTTDGTDTYLSSCSYKRSTFAVKLGYQFELTERLGLTPQLGYAIERLSGKVKNGTNLYGDGVNAGCLSLGAKLLFAPIQRLYIFANPEFLVVLNKDDDYKRITENSNFSAGGFGVTMGAIFNF